MGLKGYLIKPRWRHKDPRLRAEAVAHGDEPELLAELPELCLDDEDMDVRTAAARRVRDLEVLTASLARGRGPEERRVLEDRLRQLATSTGEDRPPLALRLKVAGESGDRVLLEQLARHAPEAELRRAAIARVSQQGVLGDVAIHDPDPAIRRAAAGRIEQASTLNRVIEATRKTDKSLHDDLLQRLRAEQLAAGDPGAVAEEALRLCSALEQLAVQRPADTERQRAGLDAAWSAVADLAPTALRQRFEAAGRRLDTPPGQAAAADEETPRTGETADADEPVETAGPAEVTEQAQGPEETPPAPGTPDKASPPPGRKAAPEAFPEAIDEHLEAFRAHLEARQLAAALEARAALLDAGKPFSAHPRWRRLQGRMRRLDGKLRELRDWQHWSNNTVRKQLIAEMEALPASGLHPDAVLARLKELQAQWKDLEAGEQIPGERKHLAAPGLWRRFQAAGRQAFQATKPFLDKRSELQDKLTDEVRGIADHLAQLAATEEVDWNALRQAISRAAQSLRRLGELPPKQRQRMGARLKKALDAANRRTGEHDEELARTKRGLIRAAEQLQHLPSRDEAISGAKSLQAQWTATGSLNRGQEQKLWQEFRSHIDPLFADLKAEQEAQREEQREALAAQQALCRQLEELLAGDDESLAAAQGPVQGLKDAWRDIPAPDKRQRSQFQALLKRYEDRLDTVRAAAKQAERRRWWTKAALLQARERAAAEGHADAGPDTAWPGESGDSDTEQALDSRWHALGQGGVAPAGGDADRARLLAIQLEFLAGLPSPEADRDLRMKYQVDRLAETLSGNRSAGTAHEEALRAEREWLLMGPLPEAEHRAIEVRVRTAIQELFQE